MLRGWKRSGAPVPPPTPDTFADDAVKLDANVNEAYMKMTVKAAGYEDFEDLETVLLYRG